MDWTSTQLCTDLVYALVYPQIFDTDKRRNDEAQTATLERGKKRAQAWLQVLDEHVLGANSKYLYGDEIHRRLPHRLVRGASRCDRLVAGPLPPFTNTSACP